jgi:hypothetical protein
MKKIVLWTCIIMIYVICLTGCGHNHTWNEATCTEPKTCTVCGITEGDALGHIFVDATCTEPKTCTVCGITEGSSLGHEYVGATCTQLGKCSRCGETGGELAEHIFNEGDVILEPTCSIAGEISYICQECGENIIQEIPVIAHTYGDYEVETEATYAAKGKKVKRCVVCGEILGTIEFELSDEEKENDFKANCQTYSYEDIARNPDAVKGSLAQFKGEVIQVLESGNKYELRLDITKTRYGYTDTIYVTYSKKSDEARILEDDIVTIWGYNEGTITYTSIFGQSITIPKVNAVYLEIE